MGVVDSTYKDFKDAVKILASANEVSLQLILESNLRKTLLLSSASYFENYLTREVAAFVDEVAAGNNMISSLVRTKVISRQYHTWFDWEKRNANKFFSLFGQSFTAHMTARIKADKALEQSVHAFLEIGQLRNLLVHLDYASYFIDKTSEEIYALYGKANDFVLVVGPELRACSASLIKPISA